MQQGNEANRKPDEAEQFSRFHTQVDQLKGGMNFQTANTTDEKLQPLIDEFKTYEHLSRLPPSNPLAQEYDVVRQLLDEIPQQVKQLTDAMPTIDVNLGTSDRDAENPTPSSLRNRNSPHSRAEKCCCVVQ